MQSTAIEILHQQTPPQVDLTPSPVVPVMTADAFAVHLGVTPATVRGWQSKGYLPSIFLGRHRLVNVAAFTRECLEQQS